MVEIVNLNVGNPDAPLSPYLRWTLGKDYYRLIWRSLAYGASTSTAPPPRTRSMCCISPDDPKKCRGCSRLGAFRRGTFRLPGKGKHYI
jgi:hypothetical protein